MMDHWNGWKNYGPRLYPGQVEIRLVHVSPSSERRPPGSLPTPHRDKCPCSHRELSVLLAELRDAMENHFHGTPPEEINKFVKWIHALGRSPLHLPENHVISLFPSSDHLPERSPISPCHYYRPVIHVAHPCSMLHFPKPVRNSETTVKLRTVHT